jgi:hypothetical protein
MIVIGLREFYNTKRRASVSDSNVAFIVHTIHAETVMAQKLLTKTFNVGDVFYIL